VAAKFDGKHARANMWVTHQNLARAKGGRPHYQAPVRKGPKVSKDSVARSSSAENPAPAAPAIVEPPTGD